MDSIAKAKEKGTEFSRRAQATPDVVENIRKMRAEGIMIRDIMAKVGLSKASVYRALGADEERRPPE